MGLSHKICLNVLQKQSKQYSCHIYDLLWLNLSSKDDMGNEAWRENIAILMIAILLLFMIQINYIRPFK